MGNTKTKNQDAMDGEELSPMHYQPPANHHSAREKMDGDSIDAMNAWVSKNIKKRECVHFIPHDGDVCGCGHTRETHFNEILDLEELHGTAWDPKKHVQEFPSDAHGDLTFTWTPRISSKYVRASCDTQPSVLFELLKEQWHLPVPSLLISVTGGAKNFSISAQLKNQFSRGLVRVAKSTGAWIITGGTHAGVMKHVGEAIKDFSGGQQNSKIVLIGIAPWGIIHNQWALLGEASRAPALYPMDEGSQGQLCCLDNNHTHFILVDDGTHGRYGVEIPLRTQLEKYISEQTMNIEGIKIPTVCVVLEGGLETLETIYSSMCNNTPCVIVEGSGRMADVIAQVANLPSSRITNDLIRDKLRNLFQDSYENLADSEIITSTKKIQDIVRMGSLLTILREERVGDQGMDVDILQALLKASRRTNDYGQENWDNQLKLAMSWNRPDIAESQIFSEVWTWKITPSDLHGCLTLSLIRDNPSFVRLFLEHGVSLQEYLTWDRLTYLYNNTDSSSLIYSKLKRLTAVQGSKEVTMANVELHHISHLLEKLLGGFTEPLYPDTKHVIQMDGSMRTVKNQEDLQKMEHPVRDLLIWCTIQNRAELADIIWNLTHDCVAGALACNKILKALAKEEERTEAKEEMMALANIYEERALGVFSECYRNDNKKAKYLLIRTSPKWGKTTALELAKEARSLLFMSQGGVQMFLTKTWWGKLSVDNGFLQILLCMLLFPLIYSGLISYRKGFNNSSSVLKASPKQTTNQSKCQNPSDKANSCFWKLKAFFNAPIVKFYNHVVSYILFLLLFAYVLMIDFQPSPSWKEYVLYAWVFTIFCEELRQLFYDPEQRGFVKKSIQYISGFWNKVDTLELGIFAVGLICRLVHVHTEYLGRIFLSLDFMIFCIRFMHMFSISKVLGPKIIILRRMVKDIFFFLLILGIWIVSYGVAKQAILTPNEQRLDWIFRNVLYEPYLALFGTMPTDVDSLNFDMTKCTQNGTEPNLPKCVYNDGAGNTVFPQWLSLILLCVYLLLANILLLNLLIAIFSYTFAEVHSQTDQIWKFHRFSLIREYEDRPAAPPPFILFIHFYTLVKHCICKHQTQSHNMLRRELNEDQESSLLSWESCMKDNYQQMKQKLGKQSQENLVKDTAERAVLRLLRIERGGDGSQLEERLSAIEEQVSWLVSAMKDNVISRRTHSLDK